MVLNVMKEAIFHIFWGGRDTNQERFLVFFFFDFYICRLDDNVFYPQVLRIHIFVQ